jgi:hypothetical protein
VPLDEVRNYYGEAVGFYFAWAQLYTKMLLWPGLLGLLLQTSVLFSAKSYDYLLLSFAIFLGLWVVVFLACWSQEERVLQFKWGVEGYRGTEKERPTFKGREKQINMIDSGSGERPTALGVVLEYESYAKRIRAVVKSVLILLTLVVLVALCCREALWMKARAKTVCDFDPGSWAKVNELDTGLEASELLLVRGRRWDTALGHCLIDGFANISISQTGPFAPVNIIVTATEHPLQSTSLLKIHGRPASGHGSRACQTDVLGESIYDLTPLLFNRSSEQSDLAAGESVHFTVPYPEVSMYYDHERTTGLVGEEVDSTRATTRSIVLYGRGKRDALARPLACGSVASAAPGARLPPGGICWAGVCDFEDSMVHMTNWCTQHWIWNFGGTFVSAISITAFSMLYAKSAKTLTQNENWRTDSEFDDALIIKSVYFEVCLHPPLSPSRAA